MRTKFAALIAAPILALGVSGCGAFGGAGSPGGGGAEQQQPESEAAAGRPTAQGSAPPQATKAIATREVSAGGAELLVEITGLSRQGRLATLEWTVTNKGDTDWSMSSHMGDTPGGMGLTVAGVSLVDTQNGKRYRVARSSADRPECVCSEYDNTTNPGEVVPLSATFAAPPPDVKKVNVDLRVLGVIRDVPIS